MVRSIVCALAGGLVACGLGLSSGNSAVADERDTNRHVKSAVMTDESAAQIQLVDRRHRRHHRHHHHHYDRGRVSVWWGSPGYYGSSYYYPSYRYYSYPRYYYYDYDPYYYRPYYGGSGFYFSW